MTGPCLCGDPYCSSCGDPGAAALEAASEFLFEVIGEDVPAENLREEILDAVVEKLLGDIAEHPERWRSLIDAAAGSPDSSDGILEGDGLTPEPDASVEAPPFVDVTKPWRPWTPWKK